MLYEDFLYHVIVEGKCRISMPRDSLLELVLDLPEVIRTSLDFSDLFNDNFVNNHLDIQGISIMVVDDHGKKTRNVPIRGLS